LKKLYQRSKKFFDKLEGGRGEAGGSEDGGAEKDEKVDQDKKEAGGDEKEVEADPKESEERQLAKAKPEDSIKTKFADWLSKFKYGTGKPWEETKSEGEDANGRFREKFVKRVGEFDPEDFSNLKARVEFKLKNGGEDKKGTLQPTDEKSGQGLKVKMEALLKRYWEHEGEVVKMKQALAAINDQLTIWGELEKWNATFDKDGTWRSDFTAKVKKLQKHDAENAETGLLLSTLKDHKFPKDAAALKSLIDDTRAVLKDHYTNRILIQQIYSAKKALLSYTDELDHEDLSNSFPAESWPTNLCDKLKTFMFEEPSIFKKFDNLCNSIFLKSKPYPSTSKQLENH
jgi:hypothetical protein